ncbi:MAG: TIGR02391 family protein, partial [Sulfuricella sp.]
MNAVTIFPEGQIEALARLLGECGSGTDISRVLSDRNLVDTSGESTKWRRLYWVFLESQKQYHCANHVLDFIQSFLTPARFVGRSTEFEARRQELNTILSFSGLGYGNDGKFRQREAAQTLDEAERRVRTIRAKFQGRSMHHEVLKYCRTELLQDNYFHAVFEASKGLAQRIRDLSGIQG